MVRLFNLIERVSRHHYTVLIVGESGSGKEMVARAIHEQGPWSRQPFLPVDCGSLAPTLIQSELFGHVRGAFTGAVASKTGLLEAAGGGTVLLDEIGEMPPDLQVKFLRALQEREVRPVGGHRRVKIAARILAATNRDLEAAVRRGAFRQDLYFRLNVVTVRVPPLRERRDDIPLLVNHFLEKHQESGEARLTVSEEAMLLLLAHDWPGNVRELENLVQRALALGGGPALRRADVAVSLQKRAFSSETRASAAVPDVRTAEPPETPERTPVAPPIEPGRIVPWAEIEKRAILGAVKVCHGDKLLAARLLGIGKTTLYRRLKEYETASDAVASCATASE